MATTETSEVIVESNSDTDDVNSISDDTGSDIDLESGDDSHDSGLDSDDNGNVGWADAMAKILRTGEPTDKSLILSKARKDSEVKERHREEINPIEIETSSKSLTENEKSSVIAKPKRKSESKSEKLKEARERKMKKIVLENMGRVKPDVTQKDNERTLSRIATRGVVQLFNAVRQQQKNLEEKLKESGESETKRDKVVKTFNKGAFLDMLKGTNNTSDNTNDETNQIKKVEEPGWNVLRDDFMMGAKMKDWDKEDDDEQESTEVT